jgi:hypothetical protein
MDRCAVTFGMGVRLLVLLGLIGHAIRDRMSKTRPEAELTTSTASRTEWAGVCRRDNAPTTPEQQGRPGDQERTVPRAALTASRPAVP